MKRSRGWMAPASAAGLLLWAMAASGCASAAADPSAPAVPNVSIWPDSPPAGGGEAREQQSVANHERFVRNVTQASLDVYLPDPAVADGSAMIVCPGGALMFLTMDGEGTQVARWLNKRGIAAFVLHYRLKPTPRSDLLFYLEMPFVLPPLLKGKDLDKIEAFAPPAIADGVQAVRFVRSQAARWHLAADRIGIIGFSAGGIVAAGTSLSAPPPDRPDFAAAIYSGPLDIGHVPADAPPLFVAAAADDPLTALGSRPIAAAWKDGGARVDLHIYDKGGHGFGIRTNGTDSDRWIPDFSAWLDAHHL